GDVGRLPRADRAQTDRPEGRPADGRMASRRTPPDQCHRARGVAEMMRKRTFWRILLALAALAVIVGIWAVYIVQTAWFFDQVRLAIINTVEKATGGRVEL